MNKLIFTVIAVAVFLAFGYGMWQLKRTINYSWSYESQVRDTVCEIVKPEYVKPGECD